MNNNNLQNKDNRTFILIHGAWHGSWSWKKIEDKMINSGYNVIIPDLPGRVGSNFFGNKKDINLRTYVDFVKKIVLKQSENPVLVGHSMAGIILSQVAEEIPELISKLVYVAAFIPINGNSLIDETRNFKTPGISKDLKIIENENIIQINKSENVRRVFYNCCEKIESDNAIEMLDSEPFMPFIDKLSLSKDRFGNVEKVYIECTNDIAISLEDQRKMSTLARCKIVTIDSDHSPFISNPEALFKAITKA